MQSFSIVFVFACGLVRTLAIDAATAILAIKVARERLDESDWSKEIVEISCKKHVPVKLSSMIECTINYEYADGEFADASVDWNRDEPRKMRIDWEESDGYCSMHPDCELDENSTDEDVLSEIEKWGETSNITTWEGYEE